MSTVFAKEIITLRQSRMGADSPSLDDHAQGMLNVPGFQPFKPVFLNSMLCNATVDERYQMLPYRLRASSRLSLSSLSPSSRATTLSLPVILGTQPLIQPLTFCHWLLPFESRTFTIFSSLLSRYSRNCIPIAPSSPRTPAAPRKKGAARAIHSQRSEPSSPTQPCPPYGGKSCHAFGFVRSDVE